MAVTDGATSSIALISTESRRRRRLMMMFGIGFVINCIMTVLQIAVLGSAFTFGTMVGSINAIACIIAFLCAYKEKYTVATGRIALYVCSFAVFSEVAASGGVTGYFGHAVIVIPVMCALVLSIKDTIALTIMSICAIGGLVTFEGVLPSYEIDKSADLVGSGMTLAWTMAGTALVAIILALEAERAGETLNEMLREQTYLARHDSLTGLYNRAAATEYLERMEAGNDRIEIFLVDLDRFKQINDQYGHAAGDDVLRTVAKRLIDLLPSSSLIARLGGDEFLIAMKAPAEGIPDKLSVGERLVEALDIMDGSNGDNLWTSASVGSAIFPDDSEVPSELLSKADAALYVAKRSGKRQFARFVESASPSRLSSSKHHLSQRVG